MPQLEGIWGEITGWASVVAGLASLACLIVRIDRPRAVAPRAAAEPARLGHAQEWALIVRHATQGLSRAAELPALQASAALKIESAEHAFNRLVADCAGLCRTLSTPPARDPVPLAGAIRTRSSRVDADPARRALAA